VSLPELTEDRSQGIHQAGQDQGPREGRVSVRNLRRAAKQAMDKAEKDSEISKDDNAGAEKRP